MEREFNDHNPLEILVTDLTYVRVGVRWVYVCFILIDKTADLVKEALQSFSYALTKLHIFHSDRGKESDNALIFEMLRAFNIYLSLSQAACLYDNALAESTYRAFKIGFINQ